MATLTIRNLDDSVKQALRERAARHGVSMEEEARVLLGQLVQTPASVQGASAYQRIRALVEPLGGLELEIPPRTEMAGDRKVFDWLDDEE